MYKNLSLIIPIFNRLCNNEKINLSNLFKTDNQENKKEEVDLEGDKIVNNITEKYIKLLETIQEEKWVKFSYESDIEFSDDDDEISCNDKIINFQELT